MVKQKHFESLSNELISIHQYHQLIIINIDKNLHKYIIYLIKIEKKNSN